MITSGFERSNMLVSYISKETSTLSLMVLSCVFLIWANLF